MIFICHNNLRNILIVKIRGEFTQDDFDQALIPKLQQVIDDYGKVNLLLEFDDDFTGSELMTLWREVQLSYKYLKSINKIAIIGNDNVIKWIFRLLHPLSLVFIERFKHGQLEKAQAWLAIT